MVRNKLRIQTLSNFNLTSHNSVFCSPATKCKKELIVTFSFHDSGLFDFIWKVNIEDKN